MTHERFMQMAIRLSEQNVKNALGGPFGAVIVREGNVIAKSANKVTSNCDPTAHAEISAIRLASKKLQSFDLSGCTIYTSCEPCPMCLGAIYWARISRVFYGNTKAGAAEAGFSDQFIYEELALPLNNRNLQMDQILSDKAILAFEMWKLSESKIHY